MIRMQSLLGAGFSQVSLSSLLYLSPFLLFSLPFSLPLSHTTHTHTYTLPLTHNASHYSTLFSLSHTHIVSLSFPLYLSNSVFVFVICLFEFYLLLLCSFSDVCLFYSSNIFLSFFANMSITFVTLFYYLFAYNIFLSPPVFLSFLIFFSLFPYQFHLSVLFLFVSVFFTSQTIRIMVACLVFFSRSRSLNC